MLDKEKYLSSIIDFLRLKFPVANIEVNDESVLHEGHVGHRSGFVTHIEVLVVCDIFLGKSILERHRLVNSALADFFTSGLHSARIRAYDFLEKSLK